MGSGDTNSRCGRSTLAFSSFLNHAPIKSQTEAKEKGKKRSLSLQKLSKLVGAHA